MLKHFCSILLVILIFFVSSNLNAANNIQSKEGDDGVLHFSNKEQKPEYREEIKRPQSKDVFNEGAFHKEQLTVNYENKWLTDKNIRTATEITFIGDDKCTMKINVNFQADNANKVIHDRSLMDAAKKVGIKRIEFHDWGNFAKEYMYYDIK
ncbi:MAG: hypothetical protein M0P74_00930 [Syntrophales bacterium]|nr:hypothetical protein [Syntrophales bacterium]